MIYTGYFAKTKKYTEAGLAPVSVAGKTPDFFEGPKWLPFAPRKDVFNKWKNKQISNDEYLELYLEYIDASTTKQALKNIKYLSDRLNIILCCYEKSGDFCHRYVLAEWLGDKLGFKIEEYLDSSK